MIKLTLLLPLKDRKKINLRLVKHLKKTRLKFQIIIADGSKKSQYKIFSSMLYMRDSDDDSKGGAFQFLEYIDKNTSYDNYLDIPDHLIKVVFELPYKSNCLLLFINGINALHAVSPRNPTSYLRKTVNFSGTLMP